LPHEQTLSAVLKSLENECSAEILGNIKAFLPLVAWTFWADVFLLACLAMARFGKCVDPEKLPLGLLPHPDQDQEVMWRLFLLVDLLITEFATKRRDLLPPPWLFRESGRGLEHYPYTELA
jgi:hypothetical protein